MNAASQTVLPRGPLPLWVRASARLPWALLYGIARFFSLLLQHLAHYRLDVVRANLTGALTSLDPRELAKIESHYYRVLGELVVETLKAAAFTADEMRSRVRLNNLSLVREELDAGRSVLIVAAHQCNWEWMLLAMSLELEHPLDAAYKPLRGLHGERVMHAIRTRFGSNLVPAKELLTTIIANRGQTRAIAMVADQEPVTTDYKWWTTFLGRETAFYMGPEKIARATRFAVMFAGMRRLKRGYYEVTFEPISAAREQFTNGDITERYARVVEREILANPGDWIWSHRRWRLRKEDQPEEPSSAGLYGSRN
jgi:KDO2-lipid IV(A) lauroyltransferase